MNEIKKRTLDSVTFTVIDKDVTSTHALACYQPHMNSLWGKKFILSPDRKSSYNITSTEKVEDGLITAVPFLIFNKWIELCKIVGCCHKNVECYLDNEGGNNMTVPPSDDKHIIYGSLCAYRWAESNAPMVSEAIEIWDKYKEDIHPMQIFHYVFGKHITNSGHSWTYISNCGAVNLSSLSMNYGNKFSLGLSLAGTLFWSWTEEERIKKYPKDTHYTQNRIAEILRSFNSQKIHSGATISELIIPYKSDEWDKIKLGEERIVLHSAWKNLFSYMKSENDINPSIIKEKYNEILKEVPEIKNSIDTALNLVKKVNY